LPLLKILPKHGYTPRYIVQSKKLSTLESGILLQVICVIINYT